MHRIDTATADANANGTGKAGFRAGAPAGTASTRLDQHWFNAIQEEIATAIEGFGGTLVKANKSQLLRLLRVQAAKAALHFRVADDTGAGTTLRGMARKSSTGKLVAVGTAATIEHATAPGAFSPASADAFVGDFEDIVYDSTLDLFIAVGAGGQIQSSSSAATWAHRASGGGDMRAVASNGAGVLVAVGESENIKRSTNGTAWAAQISPFTGSPDIVAVIFAAGLFVCVTDDDGIATSPDGSTWTQRQAPSGSNAGRARVEYNSTLGFLYHCNAKVYHSSDGTTWTQLHNAVGTSALVAGLVLVGGAWLIVKGDGSNGTSVKGYVGTDTVNAAADFEIDYLIDRGCTWMRVVNNQLYLLSGDQVWTAGAV